MLILCKAWAPRRRVCGAQNGKEAFVSLPATRFLFLCLKNKFLKGHANFSHVFLKAREMCGFSLKCSQAIKADFSQFTAVVAQGLQWRVNGRRMLCLHTLPSSHALLVCEHEPGKESVFFWERKMLWLCRNLSLSVTSFTVKSESCHIQKWRVPVLR